MDRYRLGAYREQIEDWDERVPTLAKYSRNLTLLAAQQKLPHCYARESEVEDIRISLRRHRKPNVLLTGVTGCGKTAIVEGLAQESEQALYNSWMNQPTEDLFFHVSVESPIIYELSSNALIAGARYRGDFEERLNEIMHEVIPYKEKILIFIDEAHVLSTLGAADGAISAANILKPALARGELRLIIATTDIEYQKYLTGDAAFLRRFNHLEIKPIPNGARVDCAMQILKDFSTLTNIKLDTDIDTEFLDRMLTGPLSDSLFPCTFVDIVDGIFAETQYRHNDAVSKQVLQHAISVTTGCVVI